MIGWRVGLLFRVAQIEKDRPAAGPATGFDITPAIPDHEAGGTVNTIFFGGFEQEARVGLAPGTVVAVLVADADFRQWQRGHQAVVDGLDNLPPLRSSGDVGLV